jgi:hypothetical protein
MEMCVSNMCCEGLETKLHFIWLFVKKTKSIIIFYTCTIQFIFPNSSQLLLNIEYITCEVDANPNTIQI